MKGITQYKIYHILKCKIAICSVNITSEITSRFSVQSNGV